MVRTMLRRNFKATLLVKAVERYANKYGAPMIEAFLAEPDINKAVMNFCEATINTATNEPRVGCLMASAALGQSERVAEVRALCARGLAASANISPRGSRRRCAPSAYPESFRPRSGVAR